MKFYVKQKFFSLTQDFNVWDEQGKVAYSVKGEWTFFRRRCRMVDETLKQTVADIKQKNFWWLPVFEVATSQQKVRIQRKLQWLTRGYRLSNGWQVQGKLGSFSFEIVDKKGQRIAKVSRKLFAMTDTFEIDVPMADVDIPLVIATLIVIDTDLDASEGAKKSNK